MDRNYHKILELWLVNGHQQPWFEHFNKISCKDDLGTLQPCSPVSDLKKKKKLNIFVLLCFRFRCFFGWVPCRYWAPETTQTNSFTCVDITTRCLPFILVKYRDICYVSIALYTVGSCERLDIEGQRALVSNAHWRATFLASNCN